MTIGELNSIDGGGAPDFASDSGEGELEDEDVKFSMASSNQWQSPPESSAKSVANPLGTNQYPHCPSKNDKNFMALLRDYHNRTTNRQVVARLLLEQHGISISDRTIARRWRDMGLKGSRNTEDMLTSEELKRLVTEQIAMDPYGARRGQNSLQVKKAIARRTGLSLKCGTISKIQKTLECGAGSSAHNSMSQCRKILPLSTPVGPNDEWCCDGSDELVGHGFAIWGIRDGFSGKWLGLWVLPVERMHILLPYLWLTVVRDAGGIPKLSDSFGLGRNTVIQSLTKALRAALSERGELRESPAQAFLRKVRSISVQQCWLENRQGFGEIFPTFWGVGVNIYEEDNAMHRQLAMCLLPPVLQKELDKIRDSANFTGVWRDKEMSSYTAPRNLVYHTPEQFGGCNCLVPIDAHAVDDIMNYLGDREPLMDWGVPAEFEATVEEKLRSRFAKRLEDIFWKEVWLVFVALLHFLSLDPIKR